VGLSVAAGQRGRISISALDTVIPIPSDKVAAAPLQARNAFVRSAAQSSRQQLAKSREERSTRQSITSKPLIYDVLSLRLLLPHIDLQVPLNVLQANMHST
jgi:hypothetical protein